MWIVTSWKQKRAARKAMEEEMDRQYELDRRKIMFAAPKDRAALTIAALEYYNDPVRRKVLPHKAEEMEYLIRTSSAAWQRSNFDVRPER